MKLAVLGGGAVGLALAASLAANKTDSVTLFLRGAGATTLRTTGLYVNKPDGSQSWLSPADLPAVDTGAFNSADLDFDFLFVATKAYQVADALRSLFSFCVDEGRPKAVILLQNGWGSADAARSVVPPAVPVYSGVVLAGLARVDVHHVRVNGVSAPIEIGSLFGDPQDRLTRLVENSANSLLPLKQAEDIRSKILFKLLLNTTLNATCALTGLTYGELLSLAAIRPLALSVASETLDVLAKALDFHAFKSPESFIDDYLRPLVIPKTASHRPSMAQDIDDGRETEIDYLNGAIVRLAQENGMRAPVNESLAAMIKARTLIPAPTPRITIS